MTHDTFHDVWVISVFIAYFAVLIGIAVVRVRNMSAMSDYVLGRRRLDDAGFSSAGVYEWGQSALAGFFPRHWIVDQLDVYREASASLHDCYQ